jgi:hypothetical protein
MRASHASRQVCALLAATPFALCLWAGVASAAGARPSLTDVPVADTKLVAPAAYGKASALAASGSAALDIALAIAGEFSGSTQHIIQVNEGSEAPTASRITVLTDGLLDDSVRGERWEIVLERIGASRWSIKEVKRGWRCRRGGATDRFASLPCP